MANRFGRTATASAFVASTIAASVLASAIVSSPVRAEVPPIKVVTFNIRYDVGAGNASESPEAWIANSGKHRRDSVVAAIQELAPDILGVQEALHHQVVDVKNAVPRFDCYTAGRDDGAEAGEHCAIFYRTDRFTPVSQGTFWLSEEPETAGSKHSKAANIRIASWLILADRANRDQEYFVLNTHWDHVSQEARLDAARLIRSRIPALADNRPLIVMGDMNADEDNPAIKALIADDKSGGPVLRDAYRTFVPSRTADEATFHGFAGTPTGSRIDYILHNDHFRPTSASIDRRNFDGRFPSDHFPVVVEFATAAGAEPCCGQLP